MRAAHKRTPREARRIAGTLKPVARATTTQSEDAKCMFQATRNRWIAAARPYILPVLEPTSDAKKRLFMYKV